MFSWLFPATCPVPADRKAFLERGLNWLYDEFGTSMLTRPFVLPTPEYFPDPYDESDEAIKKIFARVCLYMQVPRERVRLRIFDDGEEERPDFMREGRSEGAAGLYGRSGSGRETIQVASSQRMNPMSLVGTMAHELAHVHLLGDGRLTDDNPDHEHLTDLLTVVYGLGVFSANSVLRESNWRSGNASGWSIGRQGYLMGPEYGYAFALIAHARGESKPEWLGHLRLDVRSACKQGIRFLAKTGDTAFGKETSPGDTRPFEWRGPSGGAPPNNDLPWERREPRPRDVDEDNDGDQRRWEK